MTVRRWTADVTRTQTLTVEFEADTLDRDELRAIAKDAAVGAWPETTDVYVDKVTLSDDQAWV